MIPIVFGVRGTTVMIINHPIVTRIRQGCDPFVIQTALLIGMRIMGTGFGFFFWMMAAHMAIPDDVGRSSALISAASLIASLAQMGLGYVILRYLRQHPNPSSFIHASMVISGFLAVVLAGGAFMTMDQWFPHLNNDSDRWLIGSIVVILPTSLALSQLVHWVFLAQQRLTFSLLKQGGQAGLALILILCFQPMGGFWAIMLAYTTAVVIVTAVSIGLGLPKVIPQYQRTLSWKHWPQHALVNDAFPNYLADQLQRLPDMLLPLVVVHQAGAQRGAIFFIMWSLGSSISAWASSTADSFLREGMYHPDHLTNLVPRVLMTGFGLTLGLGSILALISPILLPWYGPTYTTNGYPFLLVLLLSNIPWVGTTLLITLLRIQERRVAVLVSLVMSNGFGSIVIMLLLPYGLLAAGWGWFGVQVAVVLGIGSYSYQTRHMHNKRSRSDKALVAEIER